MEISMKKWLIQTWNVKLEFAGNDTLNHKVFKQQSKGQIYFLSSSVTIPEVLACLNVSAHHSSFFS